MSISGVGAYGSAGLGQILAKMLSRLDSTQSITSDSKSNPTTANTGAVPAAPEDAPSVGLTGTGQSALSDQIMRLLVQLQQQNAADGTQAGTDTPEASTMQAANANDPTRQLFSAMDSNGDGVVNQAEMETYIGEKGGTQAQADALFSALNQGANGQNGSAGISEQQLAADVAQAQHSGHRHHHHHHGGAEGGTGASGTSSASDILSQIFSTLDQNQDGNVSEDEFAAAFNSGNSASSNGTAASNDPSALFSKIDSNSDGSVTNSELGNFLTSLANQVQSDFTTLGAFGQLAMQSYGASANLLDKASTGQSSYA
jgi:Ca2+-binding EF-hand superfamily protein